MSIMRGEKAEVIVQPQLLKLPSICPWPWDDPKVHAVVDKLLDVLKTPSEAVQRGSLLLSISFDAIKTS
ncbi:hypothetical protein RIF29_18794 [Crotalaria pallida]|uniref:Uncharacterized protein n=1 Tax=Crotalaria pallida TaxID=3830 RepID=A0AAN9I4X7_CROPI